LEEGVAEILTLRKAVRIHRRFEHAVRSEHVDVARRIGGRPPPLIQIAGPEPPLLGATLSTAVRDRDVAEKAIIQPK